MAIVHQATLEPTKLELIATWLPHQSWFAGDVSVGLELVGGFRFDDPDGEVGIQVLLVRSAGDSPIYQVPMTYRDAPLASADRALMGEMEHSVLGDRFVYDGCHDPIYVGELVRAVLTGGTEVVEYRHREGSDPEALPANMHVRGSGPPSSAVPPLGPLTVTTEGDDGSITATLTGEWGDGESSCLATVSVGAR